MASPSPRSPDLLDLAAFIRAFAQAKAPGLLPSHIAVHFFNSTVPLTVPLNIHAIAAAVSTADDTAAEERGGIDPCTTDILETLRAAGRPLTKTRLFEEMAKRNRAGACGEWGESTVCRRLAALMEDETIENPKGARPPGYRIIE